jgi:hypothetical protein
VQRGERAQARPVCVGRLGEHPEHERGLLHAVARGNGEFDLRQSIAQRQRTHQVAQRQQKIADVPRQHLALTDVGHIAARTLVEPDEDATLLRHVPH